MHKWWQRPTRGSNQLTASRSTTPDVTVAVRASLSAHRCPIVSKRSARMAAQRTLDVRCRFSRDAAGLRPPHTLLGPRQNRHRQHPSTPARCSLFSFVLPCTIARADWFLSNRAVVAVFPTAKGRLKRPSLMADTRRRCKEPRRSSTSRRRSKRRLRRTRLPLLPLLPPLPPPMVLLLWTLRLRMPWNLRR